MWTRLADWRLLIGIAAALSLIVAIGCAAEDEPAAAPAPAAPAAAAPAAPAAAAAPAKPAPAAPAAMEAAKYVPKTKPGELHTFVWDGPMPTKFRENPKFTELVKQGKLPPLEERLPHAQDIEVFPPADEIGVYGGEARITNAGSRFYPIRKYLGGQGNCMWQDTVETVWRPSACKSYEMRDDGKTHVFTLRRGQKWSDGVPMTMEDVKFAWEHINFNEDMTKGKYSASYLDPITANLVKFTVIDDVTFSLSFDTPYATFVEATYGTRGSGCSGVCFYSPKHHYAKLHPDFANSAELQKKIDEAGSGDWVKLFKGANNQRHTADIPVMGQMWVCVMSESVASLCANPYYYGVDPEGNQLPYLDKWTMFMVESAEVANFRAMAGETDGPWNRNFKMAELPLYIQNMEKGDYSLYKWVAAGGADMEILTNQDFNADPEMGMWVRTKDFRRALSLGIDRNEINEVLHQGMAVPQNAMVHPSHPYFPGDKWAKLDTQYDPAAANQLLDQLGFVDTDGDGFRNRKDGKGNLVIQDQVYDYASPYLDLIIPMWQKIGIENVQYREVRRAYDELYKNEGWLELRGQGNKQANPWYFTEAVPIGQQSKMLSSAMSTYFITGGKEGPDPNVPDTSYLPLAPKGNFAMDPNGTLRRMQELFTEGAAYTAMDPRRIQVAKDIWKITAEEKYLIGLIGFSGAITMKRNNMRNVPKQRQSGFVLYDMTFYFEDGIDNMNNPGNRSKKYKSENYFLAGQ